MSNRYRAGGIPFVGCIVIACHGISIKSFAWIFFIFALISFLITYIHVMLVLEINVNDMQFGANYDYVDVPVIRVDELKGPPDKNPAMKLGDDAREGKNLVTSKIMEDPVTELHGWWMPNIKWTAQIDCKTGLSHICRKVLSVKCSLDEMHSIYQFIPINPDVDIVALVFSATSSSPHIDEDYDRDSFIHSAIAYLKYTDSTYDHIRLDFSLGSYNEEILLEEKILPTNRRLDSIMVSLACRGFQGSVNFHEVSVIPTATNSRTDGDAHSFSCTRGQGSVRTNHTKEPIVEKIIEVKPSTKGALFEPTIGLVTQVNMDHIEQLHDMLSYWKQPISAAIFVPGDGQEKKEDKQNWKKLYIEKKISRMKFREGSSVLAVYAQSFQDEYNRNALRNLAFSHTSEDYILLLDAGLLPSPGFLTEFRQTVQYLEDSGRDPSKVAFVVPVFEMVQDLPIPNSKEELKALVTGDDPGAVSYNRLIDPEAHRFTDYRRWFRTKDPYKVEIYQEKYEPFVVLKRTSSMPKFDERFPDGPFDRISYTMELVASGYELLVLPNVWAIAKPSFQSPSPEMGDVGFFHQTEVYIRRFEFVAGLMRTYRMGACEQDEDDLDSEDDTR